MRLVNGASRSRTNRIYLRGGNELKQNNVHGLCGETPFRNRQVRDSLPNRFRSWKREAEGLPGALERRMEKKAKWQFRRDAETYQEVGGQRSEVGGRRSEVGGRRFPIHRFVTSASASAPDPVRLFGGSRQQFRHCLAHAGGGCRVLSGDETSVHDDLGLEFRGCLVFRPTFG